MLRRIFMTLMLLLQVLLVGGCGGGGPSMQPVTLVSISVTPGTTTISPGTTTPFLATAHFSDGGVLDATDTVTWSSSNQLVATVSNASGTRGVATAVSP